MNRFVLESDEPPKMNKRQLKQAIDEELAKHDRWTREKASEQLREENGDDGEENRFSD